MLKYLSDLQHFQRDGYLKAISSDGLCRYIMDIVMRGVRVLWSDKGRFFCCCCFYSFSSFFLYKSACFSENGTVYSRKAPDTLYKGFCEYYQYQDFQPKTYHSYMCCFPKLLPQLYRMFFIKIIFSLHSLTMSLCTKHSAP